MAYYLRFYDFCASVLESIGIIQDANSGIREAFGRIVSMGAFPLPCLGKHIHHQKHDELSLGAEY